MQNFFIGTIIFLSVIMQVSFLSNIFPAGYIPDVALIFIVIWTARIDFNSGLRWAIFGGLIMDLMSYHPVGINIFSFAAIAFIVNSLSKRFLVPQMAWKFVVLVGIVFLATMINQIVTEFLAGSVLQKGFGGSFHSVFSVRLLWKPFYNLPIFAIMYWPIRKLDKFFAYHNQRIVVKRHA